MACIELTGTYTLTVALTGTYVTTVALQGVACPWVPYIPDGTPMGLLLALTYTN